MLKSCLLSLVLVANVWADIPSDSRQKQLIHLLKHDCGSCHGLTLKGGLGPSLLADALLNKEDAFLVRTILEGRKGTAMPPWQGFISQTEAHWLVDYLRQNLN